MPFKIDRPPLGVFQWLKMFGGRGPDNLEDNIRGVVDLRDNYSAPLLVTSSNAPTVAALTGIQDTLTLTGSPCRIRGVAAELIVGAAPVTAGGFLEVGYIIGGIGLSLGAFSYSVALATQVIGFGVPVDIVLMPGTVFYSRGGGTAAGADHSLRITVLLEVWTGVL